MSQQEKTQNVPQGRDILNWKIKTLARSPREMMITQSIFIAAYMTGSPGVRIVVASPVFPKKA
ncbi:hypothetical protein PSTH68_28005 [Pseudomonas syringae pv. theae]|uniref:hypothetical protein n=1 Tax=Pseudomonas syringae TaxID=317 RepID=UPI00235B423D|nr:hypothetical protein [Pseudomonas syringae]GKQ33442.1 hypothetical protein PSTH68_28005 [Pseudomonas syringae pv. theae]